ncbi:MAG: BspA family leucine-rich repeat surface protein [Sedimentisphaerales bacterium]|nr:BspA family leucine-rich repeat surface protein [Sedimentisphaerales bacterium]
MVMSLAGFSFANCPSADLTGDFFVNLADYAILANWWLDDCNSANNFCTGADLDSSGHVEPNDLANLTNNWMEKCPAFITTWDTSLASGTTVTLALAGTVNATIDWGDGSEPNHVTTPGPHVHDYGTDGTYTVSVTGSATAYNSYENGGVDQAKLISVDNWGQLGFISMSNAFHYCKNLVSVPATSKDIATVTNMSHMFYRAYLFNQGLGSWNTSSVTNMSKMFYNADSFNGDISNWDTSSVTDMSGMFAGASSFN